MARGPTIKEILATAGKAYRIAKHLEETRRDPGVSWQVVDILRGLVDCGSVIGVSQVAAVLLKDYLVREAERTNDKTEISDDPLRKPTSQMTLREMIYVIDKLINAIEVLPQMMRDPDPDPRTYYTNIYSLYQYASFGEMLKFVRGAFWLLCEHIERDLEEQGYDTYNEYYCFFMPDTEDSADDNDYEDEDDP